MDNPKILSEFDITMLGTARVGKTSVLLSIFHEFIKHKKFPFNVEYDDEDTKNIFETKYSGLKRLSEQIGDQIEINQIPPDAQFQEYNILVNFGAQLLEQAIKVVSFGLIGSFREKSIRLKFHDYSGGSIEDESNNDSAFNNKKKAVNLVRKSIATIVVVNAPALMGDSRDHEYFNKPKRIEELLRLACDLGETEELPLSNELQASGNNQRRLVIFAPVMCEYIYHKRDCNERLEAMADKIGKEFQGLIDSLRSKGNVVVLITPIQTVGNVEYVRMFDNPEPPPLTKIICKNDGTYPFSPTGGQEVIQLLMQFLLKLYLDAENTNSPEPFFTSLRNVFINRRLRGVLTKFANSYQPKDGFRVVTGANLLKR